MLPYSSCLRGVSSSPAEEPISGRRDSCAVAQTLARAKTTAAESRVMRRKRKSSVAGRGRMRSGRPGVVNHGLIESDPRKVGFHRRTSLFRAQGLENLESGAHISTIGLFASFQETVLSNTPQILIYTTAVCPYCVAAKNFLKSKGQTWTEVRVDTDPAEREKMVALTRRTSVPQIFIGDTHVGGYDDMIALHRAGGLEPLLAG